MMLKKEALENISKSIRGAESNTSGEIRVYIARHCNGDPLETAYKKFHQLKMHKTEQRNGVLIYVSIADHKAAIFGDEGIDKTVGDNTFWNEALELMLNYFKNDDFEPGITKGVEKVGQLLKEFYPISIDDKNELDNEVIIEE